MLEAESMQREDERSEDLESLTSLEERILRTVELVSRLRETNEKLQRELEAALSEKAQAEQSAKDAQEEAARISREMELLRAERKQVRTRIEKLLGQMDLLSES
ncbi:MAG: cell division protein ZapB [Bryobacteraceae bacterium]|nr:cell division protein ZapB [Bryobacteraceae bacterium]